MDDRFDSKEFQEAYTYEGELGALYRSDSTLFRLFAPTAGAVVLNLYQNGISGDPFGSFPMKTGNHGVWFLEKQGDLDGIFYTYSVMVNGVVQEAVDPYARAVGGSLRRGMIVNLDATNPLGFELDQKPLLQHISDAIIYELHIRDLTADDTMDQTSNSYAGFQNIGKFLGLTETGTKNSAGFSTGLDHMKELGITHLHLLPIFDFGSNPDPDGGYNWGYDPENYNAPEGSYATDPIDGKVRIRELKQMVKTLHENGIRVIMDVVYNHTFRTKDSNFNKIVPDYYYRKTDQGFSNASACGNETSSERFMVQKFIVDSVVYWAKEYHLDGFRFDLMGVHDIGTMNKIRLELDLIDPTILVYGEGWAGGASPLDEKLRALKKNMYRMDPGIAAFSDDMRDALKGNVFLDHDLGFVNGGVGLEESVKFGITAAVSHPQIDYKKMINGTTGPWASQPYQCVNYASAHDNLTLWDKLTLSNPNEPEEIRLRMNLLCAAIVLTSQGIPFFQAGEELLRSKPLPEGGFDENSYRSPDSVNSIKWDTKTKNLKVFRYYQGLITFRKAHPALRLRSAKEVADNISFLKELPEQVIAYTVDGSTNEGKKEQLLLILNAGKDAVTLKIPRGNWKVYVNSDAAGTEVLSVINSDKVKVDGISILAASAN